MSNEHGLMVGTNAEKGGMHVCSHNSTLAQPPQFLLREKKENTKSCEEPYNCNRHFHMDVNCVVFFRVQQQFALQVHRWRSAAAAVNIWHVVYVPGKINHLKINQLLFFSEETPSLTCIVDHCGFLHLILFFSLLYIARHFLWETAEHNCPC